MKITVPGNPIAKPRMSQRDKWKQRPCVMRYRGFADAVRLAAKRTTKIRLTQPTWLIVKCYFDCGKTHRTGPHTQKPDADNVLKGISDALFENDEMVWKAWVTKLWADGSQPRVEIEWF